MSKHTYHDYMDALRSRDARPPFSEMASLVSGAVPRSSLSIPVTISGAAVVAGAVIAVLSFNTPTHRLATRPTERVSMPLALAVRTPSALEFTPSSIARNFDRHGLQSIPEAAAPLQKSDSAEIVPPIHTCSISESALEAPSIALDSHSAPAIALPDSESEGRKRLIAILGGAFSQQFSSSSVLRQISFDNAFAGIGYDLSEHIAVKLLGGGEYFALAASTQSVAFHDATFVHNGQTTHNVIGVALISPAASIQRVDWLGGSVQYSFGEGFRPIAEVTIAGSGNGLLMHQSVGVEHALAENFDLAMQAQVSELLPQGSSWLTKIGASASLSFRF